MFRILLFRYHNSVFLMFRILLSRNLFVPFRVPYFSNHRFSSHLQFPILRPYNKKLLGLWFSLFHVTYTLKNLHFFNQVEQKLGRIILSFSFKMSE